MACASSRPSVSAARCQRRELNYDVVRQEITNIQNAIKKKTRQHLTVIVGGAHGILSAIESLDAVKLNHDCFRCSCHSRSCNLRV